MHTRAVAGSGLLAVAGPPGSGTTSLLQAGLVGRVRRSGLAASSRAADPSERADTATCSITTIEPGTDAMAALRRAVGADLRSDRDPRAWVDALAIGNPDAAVHLLVVERLEQLFVLCDPRTDRDEFVRLIVAMALDDRCAVVAGINSEFYSRAIGEPTLADALDGRTVFVTPMSDDDIAAAIDGATGRRGVTVEPELTAAIVADLAGSRIRHQRPTLLAIVMNRLMRDRPDGSLTLHAYRELGPLATVVADTAETWWATISPSDQALAESLVMATLFIDADTVVDARRTRRELLGMHAVNRRGGAVLEALVDSGLLRSVDAPSGEQTIGVRHDVLLTGWPRLCEWVELRRTSQPAIDAVEADARAWKAAGRPNRLLYTAEQVAEMDALVDAGAVLSGDARDFLAQGHGHLTQTRRSRRGLIAAGSAAAVVVAVVGVVAAVGSGNDSDGTTNLDTALARVTSLAGTDTTAAAQVALATYRDNPDNANARAALLNTQSAALYEPLGGNRSATTAVARAADADRAAFVNADGAVAVWSTTGDTPTLSTTIPAAHDGPTTGVALDASGARLATTGADGTVALFTLNSGGAATRIATIAGRPGITTGAVAFATDRNWLAASDSTGAVTVWDLSNPVEPEVLTTVQDGSSAVRSIAFSPTAPVIAIGGDSRRLSVWSLASVDSPERVSGSDTGNAALRSITFSPTGSLAATSDEVGNSQLWTVSESGVSPVGPVLPPANSGESTATFSPDSNRLAVSSSTGSVALWDVSRPTAARALGAPMRAGGRVIGASVFSGTDRLLSASDRGPIQWTLPAGVLTGGFGTSTDPSCSIVRSACATGFLRGPVHVLDTSNPAAPSQIGTIDAPNHFDGASMSPDGQWMTTVDARHVMQLWDVANLRAPIAIGPPISLGPQQRNHLVFSPSSGLLATGIDGATSIRVWRVTDRGLETIGTVQGDSTQVDAVGFTPDSSRIAVGGLDGTVRQWQIGETSVSPAAPDITVGAPVSSLTYSGETMVVGDARGGLTRFGVDDGRRVGDPAMLAGAVRSVVASGNGVIASGADGTIRTWNPDGTLSLNGNPLGASTPGDVHVTPSNNGTLLVTGADGLQQLWSPDTAAASRRICAGASTSITAGGADMGALCR